jgi:hypothetical protein
MNEAEQQIDGAFWHVEGRLDFHLERVATVEKTPVGEFSTLLAKT